jgi:hypothetical protein
MATDNIYGDLLKIAAGEVEVAVEQLRDYRAYAESVSGVAPIPRSAQPEPVGRVCVGDHRE